MILKYPQNMAPLEKPEISEQKFILLGGRDYGYSKAKC